MAFRPRGLPCGTCGVFFETLSAFDQHLPCKRPDRWKEPRFKGVDSLEPRMAEVKFVEGTTEDPGGAVWASETTRERVDARLRSRRIRALTWEAPEKPSRWSRFMTWLMKGG